ncbi:hypothetical protein TNCT_1201, partial [Trichonephila clavata]
CSCKCNKIFFIVFKSQKKSLKLIIKWQDDGNYIKVVISESEACA